MTTMESYLFVESVHGWSNQIKGGLWNHGGKWQNHEISTIGKQLCEEGLRKPFPNIQKNFYVENPLKYA